MYVLYFNFIVFHIFSGIAKKKNPSRSENSRLVGIILQPLIMHKNIIWDAFFLLFATCNSLSSAHLNPRNEVKRERGKYDDDDEYFVFVVVYQDN